MALRVGSVDHAYRIGKYEITAGQYAEFLNAVAKDDTYGLYDTHLGIPGLDGEYEVYDANIQGAVLRRITAIVSRLIGLTGR